MFWVFRTLSVQMSAMKAANKDLKGTMKTLKMDDIDVRLYISIVCYVHFSLFQVLHIWSSRIISIDSDLW